MTFVQLILVASGLVYLNMISWAWLLLFNELPGNFSSGWWILEFSFMSCPLVAPLLKGCPCPGSFPCLLEFQSAPLCFQKSQLELLFFHLSAFEFCIFRTSSALVVLFLISWTYCFYYFEWVVLIYQLVAFAFFIFYFFYYHGWILTPCCRSLLCR